MNKLRLAVSALALGTAIYWGLTPVHSPSPLLAAAQTSTEVHQSAALLAVPANPTPLDEMGQTIQHWIDGLAVQPGFENWQRADWVPYPLGPGTHGWIVLLMHENAEVGYLVVSATPGGSWVLTEYGTGNAPLFSLNTLYRSLVQLDLIVDSSDSTAFLADLDVERLYHGPLHAVWRVNASLADIDGPLYLDAKTGEQLPLSEDPFRHLPSAIVEGLPGSAGPDRLELAVELPGFDPFLNTAWIRGNPHLVEDFPQLQAVLDKAATVTFVGDLFDRRVLAPFAVTGYTKWTQAGSPFIRLEQEGARFIPFPELFENGFFFP